MATSPTVLRWWIALELTRLRADAGITRQQVAHRLGSGVSAVTHAKRGRNLPQQLQLRTMLDLYGVPERADQFVELLNAAKKGRDWFDGFASAAPDWFDLFLGLESSAVALDSYDAMVIPGLFQTRQYAEAVIRAGAPELRERDVADRVELRLARQALLTRDHNPPRVWRVLDESVLHRSLGDAAATREQLCHLLTLAESPTVTIQVLPLRLGPTPGQNGTFTLLTLPAEIGSPTVAYTDGIVEGAYYTEPDHLRRFRAALTRLHTDALSPDESTALIAQRAQA